MSARLPTVSVVIPTFNRSAFLREAILGALDQSAQPMEIIVVDDGSTDNTADAVGELARDSRTVPIRYIGQANAGPAAARNRGITEAAAEYVAFLDSDDLWKPDRLSEQLKLLAESADIDVVFALEDKGGDDGNWEIRDPVVVDCLRQVRGLVPDVVSLLIREDFIPTSSALMRRAALLQVGLMDTSSKWAEDYDLWLRLALNGCTFAFVPRFLIRRRIHSGNLVAQWEKMTEAVIALFDRHMARFSSAARAQADQRRMSLCYDLGSRALRQGQFTKARRFLDRDHRGGARLRLVRRGKIFFAWLLTPLERAPAKSS